MHHLLDNMIWQAITTGNQDIALVEGEVGSYHKDIAPFAAMRELTPASLEQLHRFLPENRSVAISYFERPVFDETKWRPLQQMDCCQMVYEYPVPSFVLPQSEKIVPLTEEHIPAMLELTALTKPGPFLERTIAFGNYFGIFDGGRLAAMTGQRMHPVPYMEVSAVCTHPDHRGKGYAKALMLHVMKIILDHSFTPFLHVLSANTGAIHLYESIGFRVRKKIFIEVIRRLP
ncbi:MAG: GNAT family N-acetyltransferase [Chitinophagaceae bacterium]